MSGKRLQYISRSYPGLPDLMLAIPLCQTPNVPHGVFAIQYSTLRYDLLEQENVPAGICRRIWSTQLSARAGMTLKQCDIF